MKHILFVYNPVSGTGRVKKNFYEIVDFYETHDCLVTLCPIRKLGEYCDIAELKSDKYDRIVCSGGDGTLNLLLSFLAENNIHKKVAYIPAGSTNDYAYSLGITTDFSIALQRTLSDQVRQIDIGYFNNRCFLYVAGFGAFTKASYSTPQKVKNLLGYTAYILEGIKQLSEIKSYSLTLKTDDEVIEGNFILGLVTNTLSVGGFKNIMPEDVALDDGMFEIMLIKMPSNISDLHWVITSLVKEKPEENPCIVYCKTKNAQVITKECIDWTLDGEYGGNWNQVEITNIQKAMSIIV